VTGSQYCLSHGGAQTNGQSKAVLHFAGLSSSVAVKHSQTPSIQVPASLHKTNFPLQSLLFLHL